MEASSNNPLPSPPKVRNILLIYSTSSQFDFLRECEHPENLHLLQYFPKYYKTLRLKMTTQNPLLSKIKKIKRIKQIKSLRWTSKDSSLKKNWLTFFGNNRREIEEIPQIAPIERPRNSFWANLSLQEARFFSKISRHSLAVKPDKNSKASAGKTVFKYLKNMRWKKRLEIYISKENYGQAKWILERLEKAKSFLSILKMLKIEIMSQGFNIQELFAEKTVFSHLRDLHFQLPFERFDRSLALILQMCENLRSLSVDFGYFFDESPGALDFLLSLQQLPKLEALKLLWRNDVKYFLRFLKPPRSLRHLNLSFDAPNLFEGGLLKENEIYSIESRDLDLYRNLVEHWDDLKELETFTCNFEYGSRESVHFMRILMTMVLKKVLKLKSFSCQLCLREELSKNPPMYEPFFMEQVPHLYETLLELQAKLCDCYGVERPVHFDLRMLKPFKALERIKLSGCQISYMNVEEAVEVLENNQRKGVFPKLSLSGMIIQSVDQLKEILERISDSKRVEKNLKIKLSLSFYRLDEESKLKDLDKICSVINSIKPIKGLSLHLFFTECPDANLDEMRKIVEKYPEMQNVSFELWGLMRRFCYIKMERTKEQLFTSD